MRNSTDKFPEMRRGIPAEVFAKIEELSIPELMEWRSLCVNWDKASSEELAPLSRYRSIRSEHGYSPWESKLTLEFQSLEVYLGKLILRKRARYAREEME